MGDEETLLDVIEREPRTLRAFENACCGVPGYVAGEGHVAIPAGGKLVFDAQRGEPRDPALAEYSVLLEVRYEKAYRALERRFGPPVGDERDGEGAWRFGNFLVREHDHGIWLDWVPTR